jgi:hypothetical protein
MQPAVIEQEPDEERTDDYPRTSNDRNNAETINDGCTELADE